MVQGQQDGHLNQIFEIFNCSIATENMNSEIIASVLIKYT